jgi:hypothetical protein
MDYKKLLMKYMNHVGYHEGVHFTGRAYESDIFTGEEWKEIQRLSKLAYLELKGE